MSAPDPDTVRDIACQVTSSNDVCFPEVPDPPDPPSPPISDAAAGGGTLGTLLVIVLVAVLVAAIAWLLYRMVVDRRRADDDDGDDDVDEDLEGAGASDARIVDAERPPDRWRRAAEEHRRAGDFREAIRCEYRALVGDLARAGIVDEIPGRTSGEERRQLAELAPGVAAEFGDAADRFDAAWFDTAPVDRADDEAFRVSATAVLAVVGARRGVGVGSAVSS